YLPYRIYLFHTGARPRPQTHHSALSVSRYLPQCRTTRSRLCHALGSGRWPPVVSDRPGTHRGRRPVLALHLCRCDLSRRERGPPLQTRQGPAGAGTSASDSNRRGERQGQLTAGAPSGSPVILIHGTSFSLQRFPDPDNLPCGGVTRTPLVSGTLF